MNRKGAKDAKIVYRSGVFVSLLGIKSAIEICTFVMPAKAGIQLNFLDSGSMPLSGMPGMTTGVSWPG